jgi:membrane-associated phospholipid phosphatase
MLLWAGVLFILLGAGCVAIDRRAVHFFHARVSLRLDHFLKRTTHLAKAGHWLIAAVLVYGVCWLWLRHENGGAAVKLVFQAALAFILALGAGSAILHIVKLFLGRRRPRDELEMGLYGFLPLRFSLSYNSFPSGHALTIFCVAVVASALWPQAALLWFAAALWLGLTRAMLNAHFLSDVFVGAGVGLISGREVMLLLFPQLTPGWF